MGFFSKFDKKASSKRQSFDRQDKPQKSTKFSYDKGEKRYNENRFDNRSFQKSERNGFMDKPRSSKQGFSKKGFDNRGEKRYGENRFNSQSFERRSYDEGFGPKKAKPFGGEKRGFNGFDGLDKRSANKGRSNQGKNSFEDRGFDKSRSFEKKPFKDYKKLRDEKPFENDNSFENKRLMLDESNEETPSSLIVGRNPIREAIKAGRDIEKLLIQEGELLGSANEIVALARKNGIKLQYVNKKKLNSYAKNHQGLIAFASAHDYSSVEDILVYANERGEAPFIIILDKLSDPHNLGAIIRSCACMGAHGVIIPQHRSVGLTPSAVKTSAGAVEYIRVAKVTNISRTIEELKKLGVWIYATAADGEDYRSCDFTDGVGLVIGSEGDGISKLVREQCDKTISIPMSGEISSLNASVAAGVLMHAVYISRNPLK